MTIVLIFQKTTKTSSRSIEEKKRVVVFVFLGLPQMQCACVTLCDEKEGMPEPALHIPRWPLDQSENSVGGVVIEKWVAFLNKNPQRGRDGHRGNEVGTLRRDTDR